MNYSEPPFCKMFRDMDLLLLQWAALSYPPPLSSSGETGRRGEGGGGDLGQPPQSALSPAHSERSAALLVNHLLHRFGLWHHLLGEDAAAAAEARLGPVGGGAGGHGDDDGEASEPMSTPERSEYTRLLERAVDASLGGVGLAEGAGVASPSLRAMALPLAEELLLLLILLVSELPLPHLVASSGGHASGDPSNAAPPTPATDDEGHLLDDVLDTR